MAYEISFDEKNEILSLSHFGDYDMQELGEGRAKVTDELKQRKTTRLLVDTSNVNHDMSTLNHFEFTSSNVKFIPVGVAIALVINPKFQSDGKFVENVAVNRGINMKVFFDRNTAIHWLKQHNVS